MQDSSDSDRERELVSRAHHDLSAFQELYQAYFPRVFAYVSYRVGDVEQVEDLVSTIFLRILENFARFEWRGEGSLAAWVFRTAHNVIIDHYRRSGRQNYALPLEHLPDIQSNVLLPVDLIQQKEKFAYLRSLISALPPRRQEIITLRFFGGLRNTEIAQVLGLDEHSVASNLYRGLADLHRRYLNETGSHEDDSAIIHQEEDDEDE